MGRFTVAWSQALIGILILKFFFLNLNILFTCRHFKLANVNSTKGLHCGNSTDAYSAR
jgi:hypothetical protein